MQHYKYQFRLIGKNELLVFNFATNINCDNFFGGGGG